MSVTPTVLTSGTDTTDGTTFTTASVTPTANRLLLLQVLGATGSGSAADPDTITGCGLTWVKVSGRNSATTRRIIVYRAMGPAPTSGSITITWPATRQSCSWILTEFDGVDTNGSNGAAAIGVTGNNGIATSTANAGSVTLPPPATRSATYVAWFIVGVADIIPSVGFSDLAVVPSTLPSLRTEAWFASTSGSVDATWGGGTTSWAGIAIEIRAADSGPAVIQSAQNTATVGATLPNLPSAGNTLIVSQVTQNSVNPTAPTTNGPWTQILTPVTNSPNQNFWWKISDGTEQTVFGDTGSTILGLTEVAGLGPTPVVGSNAYSSNSGASLVNEYALGPLSVAEDEPFVFAAVGATSSTSTSVTWTNGFVGITPPTTALSYMVLAYLRPATSGSYSTTVGTFPTARRTTGAMISFSRAVEGEEAVSKIRTGTSTPILKLGTQIVSAVYQGTTKVWG